MERDGATLVGMTGMPEAALARELGVAVRGDRRGRQPRRRTRRLRARDLDGRHRPGAGNGDGSRARAARARRAAEIGDHDSRRPAHGRSAAAGSASAPVERFGTPELEALLADMRDTMAAQNGAGLAAPQIGVPLRVVIFGVEHNPRYPDAEPVPYTELVNPVLTPLVDEMEEGWEGCLSVPGAARRRAALHAAALRGLRSAGQADRARRRRASTRASCSTNAITWTASCIRCACATSRASASPTCCFPDADDRARRIAWSRAGRGSRNCSYSAVSSRSSACSSCRPRAVDQEDVLGALAQRVDLGAGDVDVAPWRACRRSARAGRGGRRRRSPGCSACPCRRERCWTSGDSGKCLTRRLTRPGGGGSSGRCSSSTRFSSNSTSWIVSRYDALRLGGIVDGERVERVAMRASCGSSLRGSTGRRGRRSRRRARTGPSGPADRRAPAGRRRRATAGPATTGAAAVDAVVEMARVPRDLLGACGAGNRRCRAATTASARRRRESRTGAAGGCASCWRCCRLSASVGAPDAAGQPRARRVEQVLEQLRLPRVPHLGARAADVGDGEQVERDEAAVGPHRRRKCRDHVRVGDVLLLRDGRHAEMALDQPRDELGVLAPAIRGARQKRRASRSPSRE